MLHWIKLALLVAMAGLLIAAAWGDLRARIIPNWLNAAIACVSLAWWVAAGLSPAGFAIQLGVALVVFALFTVCFALGMMGGGDVKMIGALAIWLPFDALITMLTLMALAGGAITLVLMIRHRLKKAEGQPEIPYGVAIAIAGLAQVGERYLYHFG
jgi:prepilin peptidase CpaA